MLTLRRRPLELPEDTPGEKPPRPPHKFPGEKGSWIPAQSEDSGKDPKRRAVRPPALPRRKRTTTLPPTRSTTLRRLASTNRANQRVLPQVTTVRANRIAQQSPASRSGGEGYPA